MASPNMGLTIPIVGVTPGPDYAVEIDADFILIDAHNHSPGQGALVNTDGLNINADLTIQNNNLTNTRTLRFTTTPATTLGPSDLAAIYVSSGDLYYVNTTGVSVRLTNGGSIAGTTGSITGLTPPASASYNVGTGTFIFQSAALTPANLDAGSIILRNSIAGSFGLTLSPPILVSNYTITLPTLPGVPSFLTIDSSGNITNTTAVSAGILGTNIAPNTISTSNLAFSTLLYLSPPGVISAYGGTSAPTGYLMCDGASVLRASFPDLFAIIGTAFGFADGTHFNVPDLRGQFLRGVDSGAGRDPDAASRTVMNTGGNTGDNVGSIQPDEFRSHTHTTGVQGGTNAAGGTVRTEAAFGNTGATGGNETRPINAYVNYIIKT